jgi:hypothetical protein
MPACTGYLHNLVSSSRLPTETCSAVLISTIDLPLPGEEDLTWLFARWGARCSSLSERGASLLNQTLPQGGSCVSRRQTSTSTAGARGRSGSMPGVLSDHMFGPSSLAGWVHGTQNRGNFGWTVSRAKGWGTVPPVEISFREIETHPCLSWRQLQRIRHRSSVLVHERP